jgi:hypothetical protein
MQRVFASCHKQVFAPCRVERILEQCAIALNKNTVRHRPSDCEDLELWTAQNLTDSLWYNSVGCKSLRNWLDVERYRECP